MAFERKDYKGFEKRDNNGFDRRDNNNGFNRRDNNNGFDRNRRPGGFRDKKPEGMGNGRIDNFEKPLLALLKEISEKLDILINKDNKED